MPPYPLQAPAVRVQNCLATSIGLLPLFQWLAYNMVGAVVPADKINTPGLYVLDGYSQQNILAYRKKHVFVRWFFGLNYMQP